MKLYDAIENRISSRKYENRTLSEEQIKLINQEIKESKSLFPEIKTRLVFITDNSKTENLLTGMVGNYGKVDAPYCLVAISEDKKGYMENVGFIQEQIVLKLTSMGIGTCWLAGSFNRIKAKEIIGINENEIITNVIAIGYPRDSMYNKGIRMILGCTKRKDRKEIAFYKKWNEDSSLYLQNNSKTGKILDMSIRYPSAVNKQPVRVVLIEGKAAFYTKAPVGEYKKIERMDAGIFISHFYLSCLEEGYSADILFEGDTLTEISAPEDFSYICSIKYQ